MLSASAGWREGHSTRLRMRRFERRRCSGLGALVDALNHPGVCLLEELLPTAVLLVTFPQLVQVVREDFRLLSVFVRRTPYL